MAAFVGGPRKRPAPREELDYPTDRELTDAEKQALQMEMLAIVEELKRRNAPANEIANQTIQVGKNPYAKYSDDPISFAEEVLGIVLWSKQKEILTAIRDNSRISVKSCHGVGKTFLAAVAVLWFLYSKEDSIVISTATNFRQVKNLLWREIRSLHKRANLPGICNQTELSLGPKWYALGFSTDDPDAFQGVHAENILLVYDEAAGVPQSIYTAGEGTMTSRGAKQLLIGNPTTSSERFFDTHHELSDLWSTHSISAFESPNFTGEEVPEFIYNSLISLDWVEKAKREWGEDSPIYQSRVLAEFPDQAENALIPLSWIVHAKTNFFGVSHSSLPLEVRELDDEGIIAGIDVARSGQNRSAICIRQGPLILHQSSWQGAQLTDTSGRVQNLCRQFGVTEIRVDVVGVGAGLYEMLHSAGLNAVEVISGSTSNDPSRFTMYRDEMYWALRDRFRDKNIGPLLCDKTAAQLSSLRYNYDARGKVKIESKDDMRKRGLPSPDEADALALAFLPTQVYTADPVSGGSRELVVSYVWR